MYLCIFDNKVFEEERQYYYCRGEYYQDIKEAFPETLGLKKEEIQGVVVYAGKTVLQNESALTFSIERVSVDENEIKLTYGTREDCQTTCGEVKKKIQSVLRKKGLLKEGVQNLFISILTPSEFEYILSTPQEGMEKEIELFKRMANWRGIIKLFGELRDIEKSKHWNDIKSLNELTFALAKMVNEDYEGASMQEKEGLKPYFLKCINRCIEKEPTEPKHKSLLAFYYYNQCITQKRLDMQVFNKAVQMYEQLIPISTFWYKEKYRYVKLQQTLFEKKPIQNPTEYYRKREQIIQLYQSLIEDYKKLPAEEKKRELHNYVKVLYSCGVLLLKEIDAWKIFVECKVYGNELDIFSFSNDRMGRLVVAESYFKEVISLQKYDEEGGELKKPELIFVLYNLADIENKKGIVAVLRNRPQQECSQYFIKSNELIEKANNFYQQNKTKRRLGFPYYLNPLKAINCYFLGKVDKIDECFVKPRSYMYYIHAILCVLLGNKPKALSLLKNIERRDQTNFRNAEKLIRRLKCK